MYHISMEGIRLRHISGALGALFGVAVLSVAAPSNAAPVATLIAPVISASQQAASVDGSGVRISRVFESRADSDIVSFSKAEESDGTPVSGSVSDFSMALPLRAIEQTATPHLFGTASATPDALRLPWNANTSAQAIGMQIDVAGGAQATFTMQTGSSNFGMLSAPSQQPAVFAFYNFPERSTELNLRSFGPADAATAPAVTGAPAASATVFSSPLIGALSAQGPFWYNGSAPARGTSLSLTLPFHLARIPVKVHLGEQSLEDVPTSSLANQILGPAFASSALQYNAVTGGVSVALPVLSRRATVSLDGLYETLQQGNQAPFSLVPYAAQTGTSGAPGAVIFAPTNGIEHYAGAATVALPVTSRLTVNGTISEQVSGNVALDALTQTLTQHQTGYSGGVAYNFPKTNSSIEFFSNRSVLTDDNLPNYNVTQSSQNLYFSVKF
jgi:hypothetical protein